VASGVLAWSMECWGVMLLLLLNLHIFFSFSNSCQALRQRWAHRWRRSSRDGEHEKQFCCFCRLTVQNITKVMSTRF
jgi:hypothetical protein